MKCGKCGNRLTFRGVDILSKRLYKKYGCSRCGDKTTLKTETVLTDRKSKPTAKDIISARQLMCK